MVILLIFARKKINMIQIKVLRKAANVTQMELAAELGLSNNSYISNVECGRRAITQRQALRISKAIDRIKRIKAIKSE